MILCRWTFLLFRILTIPATLLYLSIVYFSIESPSVYRSSLSGLLNYFRGGTKLSSLYLVSHLLVVYSLHIGKSINTGPLSPNPFEFLTSYLCSPPFHSLINLSSKTRHNQVNKEVFSYELRCARCNYFTRRFHKSNAPQPKQRPWARCYHLRV